MPPLTQMKPALCTYTCNDHGSIDQPSFWQSSLFDLPLLVRRRCMFSTGIANVTGESVLLVVGTCYVLTDIATFPILSYTT